MPSAWSRPRELVQLLDALAAQDLAPERFEVLVVDDGSAVAAAPLLERRAFPFDLKVLTQAAAGPAAARNRGLANARGRLVVFFNDDAVPAPDCLRRHLMAHAVSDEPRAVLGSFRLLQKHVRDSFAVHVETSTALFAQPRMKPGVRYHGLALCTGNVSLRRDHLAAVGGFDESLPYAGGEDSELGLRLERELGLRVVFDPRVQAGHDHPLDAAGFAQRRRAVGWTSYRIEQRHPGTGLVAVGDWTAFAAEVDGEAGERATLTRRIAAICAEEEMGERPRGKSRELAALAERLGELEFRRGALLAHQGGTPRGGPQVLERAPGLAPGRDRAGTPPPGALLAGEIGAERAPQGAADGPSRPG